jgi:uncharacterized protein (TIGR04222 family)
MIEAIQQIPGPVFLIYYAALAVACIVVARWWSYSDGTRGLTLPDLTRFNPFALAYLAGGWKPVFTCAIFSLWNKKLLEVNMTKGFILGTQMTIESVPAAKVPLNRIEEAVYEFLIIGKSAGDLFKDKVLRDRIEALLRPYAFEIERSRLIRNEADYWRAWSASIAMFLVLLAVGGTKFYLGITHNRPSEFLLLLFVFSSLFLFQLVRPWARPTSLGIVYLKTLSDKFGWMKERLKKGSYDGFDPVLGLAVFGLGALAGNTAMAELFKASSSSSSGGCSGGGCGGGGGGCGGCGS